VIDKENGGYGSTINVAVRVCQGKYFRLLDGDDWYDKNELVQFLNELRYMDADLVLNNFSIFNEKDNKVNKMKFFSKTNYSTIPIVNLPVRDDWAMYSFCYKTELIRNKKITEKCFYTDIEYIVLPLVNVKTYSYSNSYLYQYRIGRKEQSVSKLGMKKHYLDYQKVLDKLYAVYDNYKAEDNVCEIIKKYLELMQKKAIKSFCCVVDNKRELYELKKYDKMLKQRNEKIYNTVSKKDKYIWLLRKMDYKIYWGYKWLI
jgi:glycosyltransferase involved in cell wall biosynthesis